MNSPNNFGHKARHVALWSLISGGLALMAGCASEPESHVVSAPPPPPPGTQTQVMVTQPQQQTTTTQTTTTGQVVTGTAQTANGTIIVMQAPPALQQEVVQAQPSPDHKWIPGYWTWHNSRYEWVSGHWELPPSSSSVWVAPRWEPTSNGGYRFYEGYWN